jgi:hypothetical protein
MGAPGAVTPCFVLGNYLIFRRVSCGRFNSRPEVTTTRNLFIPVSRRDVVVLLTATHPLSPDRCGSQIG